MKYVMKENNHQDFNYFHFDTNIIIKYMYVKSVFLHFNLGVFTAAALFKRAVPSIPARILCAR
jgi:hypothetical protein